MNAFLAGITSARAARRAAPWASVVIKVDGGYMVFEFTADADRWKAQR